MTNQPQTTASSLVRYRRWVIFSGRLAQCAFPRWRKTARKELLDVVIRCISVIRSNYDLNGLDSWDGVIGDDVDRLLWDWGYIWETPRGSERRSAIGSAAMACIRAGVDVAIEPSAGVVGFTVGDLRRMFPRGLPDWVQSFFEVPIGAGAPNSEGVWL